MKNLITKKNAIILALAIGFFGITSSFGQTKQEVNKHVKVLEDSLNTLKDEIKYELLVSKKSLINDCIPFKIATKHFGGNFEEKFAKLLSFYKRIKPDKYNGRKKGRVYAKAHNVLYFYAKEAAKNGYPDALIQLASTSY